MFDIENTRILFFLSKGFCTLNEDHLCSEDSKLVPLNPLEQMLLKPNMASRFMDPKS